MIIKTIDEGRRLGIPKEILTAVGIRGKTDVKIDVAGDKIVLTKAEAVCRMCGSEENIIKGFPVCRDCAEKVADLLKLT